MNYTDVIAQDFRLVVIRALSEQNDYTLNESILVDMSTQYGHRATRDYARAELRWLESVGAITVQEAGTVLVATLTERGLDHVELRMTIDGIKRPSPPRA